MLIAVTGEAYAGKTTLAKALAEKLGTSVHSFGNGPKEVATMMTGIQNWDVSKGQFIGSKLGRTVLIELAEGMKAILGQDVWVRYLLERRPVGIIDDLRFLIESEALDCFKIRVVSNKRLERASKFGDPVVLLEAAKHGDREVSLIVCDMTVNTDLPLDMDLIIRNFKRYEANRFSE